MLKKQNFATIQYKTVLNADYIRGLIKLKEKNNLTQNTKVDTILLKQNGWVATKKDSQHQYVT